MILIVTPTLGNVRIEFMQSMMLAHDELRAAGVRHRLLFINGVSPIQFARNEAINAFHELEDATHLMMIDDDMVFTASDIIALKAAEKPVVGALCPLKTAQAAYNAEPSAVAEAHGECVTVNALGTGFMMIERRVIEEWIAATEPELLKNGDSRWALFDCEHYVDEDGTRRNRGEDYTFCIRVRERGHRVWVHTALSIGHVGTHVFTPRHTASQRLDLLKGAWSAE